MKGLLIKDWKTLLKQMKVMLVIVVVFVCIPGTYMAAFALFYAAMLPITALAYDERAKWDELAAMMPYTVKSIVGSKYVLGLTLVLPVLALSMLSRLIVHSAPIVSEDNGVPVPDPDGHRPALYVPFRRGEGPSDLHSSHLRLCSGGRQLCR